jgi:hypothetical protein
MASFLNSSGTIVPSVDERCVFTSSGGNSHVVLRTTFPVVGSICCVVFRGGSAHDVAKSRKACIYAVHYRGECGCVA